MADARQGFTTEAVRPNGCQIFKGLEFGGSESLTEDG